MHLTAHLCTSFDLDYTDSRGRERYTDLEVEYDFDGADKLQITRLCGAFSDWDEDQIYDLAYRHLDDVAPEAYAEWLADYGEHLSELALDRETVQ